MRGISSIFISRAVFRNKGDKGTGIAYDLLIRRKMYQQLKTVLSSILRTRNLKFAEHDNKVFVCATS